MSSLNNRASAVPERETTLQISIGENRDGQQQPSYHTLRYGFIPASVNSEEPATLELTDDGEVTIKAPNIGGSSSSHTIFRGSRKPHVKECLLIIDNSTGEMVLQKLNDNITVKLTRNLGTNSNNSNSTTTAAASGSSGNSSETIPQSSGNANIVSQTSNVDGPQLSEESSSSSDSSDSDSSSSSSSSSGNSSPENEGGFTF